MEHSQLILSAHTESSAESMILTACHAESIILSALVTVHAESMILSGHADIISLSAGSLQREYDTLRVSYSQHTMLRVSYSQRWSTLRV
jgi:hypothetical protein